MKYLVIYWIWIDCTISITIEKFDSCDFTKTYGQVFHSKKHKCVEKKFVKKLLPFERWQKLFWKFLYQNPFYMFIKTLDEIKKKTTPKIYQNITKKNTFSYLKQAHVVWFHLIHQNKITYTSHKNDWNYT
jgi:hypothetical protein